MHITLWILAFLAFLLATLATLAGAFAAPVGITYDARWLLPAFGLLAAAGCFAWLADEAEAHHNNRP